MSNEVIKVLDYLGEKLGLAIDWSSENVFPQVMEFIGRYRVYEICESAFIILIHIVVLIACFVMAKKLIKACKSAIEKDESNWAVNVGRYDADISGYGVFIIIICGIGFLISAVGIICEITELMKWTIVPEFQFVQMIQNFVKAK